MERTPKTIASFTAPVYGKNPCTRTIPASISDMLNLEVLDLSFNNLFGLIPLSFNKLKFLSKFSVAYNHLRGAILTGEQFFSFPNSSFEGNSRLCGNLLSLCAVNNMGIQPVFAVTLNKKFGRSSILGVTISIGVGVVIFLAIVLLKLSRRDMRNYIEDLEDEISRAPWGLTAEGLGWSEELNNFSLH